MEKRDLFQIGEVAALFHISVGTLRHYEKLGLVQPEYTDPATGYRYYSPRQFECLHTIRYLRALDMPLEDIARFLQNREVDHIHALLKRQQAEVIRRQQELAAIQRKIENRLSQLEDALTSKLNVITEREIPLRRLAVLRKSLAPKSYLDLECSIRELEQDETSTSVFLGKVGLGLYASTLNRRQFSPYELIFLILDEEDRFQGNTVLLPAETCVVTRFPGSHRQAARSYELLLAYIKDHAYTITGFSKEITLIDNGLTNDVSRFVTEIQIPVDTGRTGSR